MPPAGWRATQGSSRWTFWRRMSSPTPDKAETAVRRSWGVTPPDEAVSNPPRGAGDKSKNTKTFNTLPKAWQAGLGCASCMDEQAQLWTGSAYEIILDAIPSDEFPEYMHLKWLLSDLRGWLQFIFEV